MRRYTFYWKDGTKNVYKGSSPADALTRAGYGAGALDALDFHTRGSNSEWIWNQQEKKWIRR